MSFLSSLTIINALDDPTKFSSSTKSWLVFTVALAATNGPLSCGILFPALASLESDFQVLPSIANLSISFFLLGMGLSPIWFSYFSEHFGRRPIYISTFALFFIFTILAGFSNSMTMFLIFRFLAALASGSAQALGAGTIADIYVPCERGTAMGYFYLGPLVGPITAPILGGALVSLPGGWRNTQWILSAFIGISLATLVFILPETHHPSNDHKSITQLLYQPLTSFKFFKIPQISISIVFASLNFGFLYILNIAIESGFRRYDYSPIIIGVLYLGNSTGYWIGSIIGGKWSDSLITEKSHPVDRISVNVYSGALLVPLGLLLFGWTIQFRIIFIVPLIGTFIYGFGTMLVFSAITTYLVDLVPGRGSSIMAMNNLVRNLLACIFSAVAGPLIHALGYGILFTIIGGVLLVSTAMIPCIKKVGRGEGNE